MNHLYVIGTPIGNLEDITVRALAVLNSVDCILCEDTRTTKILLDKYNISKKTLSYHSHSSLSKVTEIVDLLRNGKNMALVSDAGTPAISDPGSELIKIIRRELNLEISEGNIKIESIPGPSALTASLSIAGVPVNRFTFLGFLPHKKGREKIFSEIYDSEHTYVFYESTHRIMKTLQSLLEKSKNTHKTKIITVCREITKIFEEVVQGSESDVLEYFSKNTEKVRGEFVVIVSL